MKALQYIYTSWRNGDSTEKGYMIYSKSVGITNDECDDIRFVMQYMVPKDLTVNPTAQEIADSFPYNFAYFTLSSKRACISQSTYLGKDYSGRFGNYIIYALVIEQDELEAYPVDFFGEKYIKTEMTDEELAADPPVPPLPVLEINSWGNVINDDQIMEFLYDKEEKFACLVSAVLEAEGLGIPFYLNDVRENLVLWIAALHRMLPLAIAKKITFSTYVGDHEKFRTDDCKAKRFNLTCLGVRPGANYFDYVLESNNRRQIVIDFIGNSMTRDIKISPFSKAIALSYTLGMDDIHQFSSFLNQVRFTAFDKQLEAAFCFHRLVSKGKFSKNENSIPDLIEFGERYCSEELNTDIALKLISLACGAKWGLSAEEIEILVPYLFKHSSFMIQTIHEILLYAFYSFGEVNCTADRILQATEMLEKKCSYQFVEFLKYFSSKEIVEQSIGRISGDNREEINVFFAEFIIKNYQISPNIKQPQIIEDLLAIVIKNILQNATYHTIITRLFKLSKNNIRIITDMLVAFIPQFDEEKLNKVVTVFKDWSDTLPKGDIHTFQTTLLNNAKTGQFVLRLYSLTIRQSQNPEMAFWEFYRAQRRFLHDSCYDISPLVSAYLESSNNLKAALDVSENIELSDIKSPKTGELLLAWVETQPIKKIISLDGYIVNCLFELISRFELFDLAIKTIAVYMANHTKKRGAYDAAQNVIQPLTSGNRISFDRFDKKDYAEYLSEYFYGFVSHVSNSQDVKVLVDLLFQENYFDEFSNQFVGALRKLERKEESRWRQVLVHICIYIINYELNDVAAKTLAKPIKKYLDKCNDEDFHSIKVAVLSASAKGRSSNFFEREAEKPTGIDKISRIFKPR
jgi:hypothetical protein